MKTPPQKPIDGLVVAQLSTNDPDRLQDRRVRLADAQALDVRGTRDRLLHDGPDVLDELDVDAHPEHRQHDVREHHRGVDVVAANRLQRHLCTEVRVAHDVEERAPSADFAVLRQRAARLTHEPDRRALDRLAPGGAHEQRFHSSLD